MTEPGGGRECRTGRLPLARTDENVRHLQDGRARRTRLTAQDEGW